MNLRDLHYLTALAEHRHFRKASEACCVTQPALSIQIKKLEETLGVQLVERTNKSVRLTTVGLAMAERARSILAHEKELWEIAKAAKNPYSGELTLGIFPTIAPYLLPLIMPRLAKKFSQLRFYLIEEKTDVLIEKLKEGFLDAAILALPLKETAFTKIPLFVEEFLLAIPETHHFIKHKSVKASNLKNQTLLLLEEGHCMREQTSSFCKISNAGENDHFRATSLETLRNIIATGMGMTLMPALAMKPEDIIAYIPFESPKPARTIGFCYRHSTARQLVLADIVEHIKEIMGTHPYIEIIS